MPHKPTMFLGVRFSVAGLDPTKFSFSQFQSLLFVVVKVISILLKQTHFQSIVSQWWKFYGDWTRIKPLLRQLKNTGMVSKTPFRNTLRLHDLSLRSKCFRISSSRSESWDKTKKKSNEGAGERGKHLSTNPTILKNPIRLPNAASDWWNAHTVY